MFEFAVGKAVEGKEEQLFGQYFPQVGPIVGSHGGRPVGGFQVLSYPAGSAEVAFGALFLWPSRAAYDALHADEAFKAVVPLRDEAMSVLNSGNFFDTGAGAEVTLDPAQTYAIVMADHPIEGALLALPAATDTQGRDFAGKTLSILPAETAPECDTRFEIRMNPPA
ncbi:hypothetical protein ACMU_10545 [Actibacterium mucosum KCTC 23349]|uniref:DUF1330 domain-containing protein n=1 Tax=Actibacterium mucosum KCTC 23349 TaxID=1454373 RepID=A0A037ZKV1_9RHOB|nr:hypothetical protein ACMU_10545 [Actibacterium mucosum KCTC 23349]